MFLFDAPNFTEESPAAYKKRSFLTVSPFFSLCWLLSSTVLYSFCNLKVTGRKYLPRSGPFILASTHQSFLDPMMLGVAAQRPLVFMARRTLFRHPIFSALIRNLFATPVPRDTLSPDTLRRAVKVLTQGWPLVIFPEGTRTADGAMGPLRRGVSLLAARAGVPVIPARVTGAFQVWPRQKKFPFPGPITVAFGPLLLYHNKSDTYNSFTSKLTDRLAQLADDV